MAAAAAEAEAEGEEEAAGVENPRSIAKSLREPAAGEADPAAEGAPGGEARGDLEAEREAGATEVGEGKLWGEERQGAGAEPQPVPAEPPVAKPVEPEEVERKLVEAVPVEPVEPPLAEPAEPPPPVDAPPAQAPAERKTTAC